jgi:hypothetical protein
LERAGAVTESLRS